jgi:stalled ribosome rescue protein Dom34
MIHTTKKLGIWMDHANAFMTEFTTEPMSTTTIASAFTHQEKNKSMAKNEALSHHKEQHQQAAFYKELIEMILHFDHVILFGPTDAKSELHNILKEDHHFDKIIIEVKSAESMSEHAQQLFVKNHFSHKN